MWPKRTSKRSWYAPYGLDEVQEPGRTGVSYSWIMDPPIDQSAYDALVLRALNLNQDTPVLYDSQIGEIVGLWRVIAYQARMIEDLRAKIDKPVG